MSLPNDPYLTVPNYGQQNQNFGKEKLYSGYTAPSAVSDLVAAAAASNLQTGARTPDKGKYVYDSKTGQYIWVPATAAAAVSTGVSASPYYQNQNQERLMPGRGDTDPKEQARIDAFMDAEDAKDIADGNPVGTTRGARIKDDLSFLSFLNPLNMVNSIADFFGGNRANINSQVAALTGKEKSNRYEGGTTNPLGNAPFGGVLGSSNTAPTAAELADPENSGLGRRDAAGGTTTNPLGDAPLSGGPPTGGKPGESAVGGTGYGFSGPTNNSIDGGWGSRDAGGGGSGEGGLGEGSGGGRYAAAGGIMDARYARGGLGDLGGYSDGGRLLRGPGDGVSDSIPASIGGKRPARLADGEFVVPARIVSELGNGSTEAGARKLYAMLDRIQAGRKKTVGKGKVATNSRSDKNLPA